jgi:DNA-binding beta-propeller fold protein YncE
LALSPDGGYLYITGVNSNSLTVLSRNLTSGGAVPYGSLNFFGPNVVQEALSSANLNEAYGVTLSPDGKNIYVANYGDSSVTVFARDGSTGKFTTTPADRKVQGQAGVDGINGVFRVIISPDGAYVYTAAFDGNSVAGFQRDPASGALSGTPTTPGVFGPIVVTAANGIVAPATQTFSITIAPPASRRKRAFALCSSAIAPGSGTTIAPRPTAASSAIVNAPPRHTTRSAHA